MIRDKDVYVVVLAGGSGTRFWPKSRLLRPKQLCGLGDSVTMLEKTLTRVDNFVPVEQRIIVTHTKQKAATNRIVLEGSSGPLVKAVIGEPEAKNTAAALALGALEIANSSPNGRDSFMISLHADHVIKDVDKFKESLSDALETAKTGKIVLLGIPPKYAETGYGYIECGDKFDSNASFVKSFREKPDKETAEEYLKKGNFLWNSGLFVWKVSTILDELEQWLPETYSKLSGLFSNRTYSELDPENVKKIYSELDSIAIDNAVFEKTDKNVVIPAKFDWQDVGSWDALSKCFPTDQNKNYLQGNTHIIDSKGVTIDSENMFVAAIGMEDCVIVESGGAILVCHKDRAQEVKKVVAYLKENEISELL